MEKDISNTDNNTDSNQEEKKEPKIKRAKKSYVVWKCLAALIALTTLVVLGGSAVVMQHVHHINEDCEEHIAEIHYS